MHSDAETFSLTNAPWRARSTGFAGGDLGGRRVHDSLLECSSGLIKMLFPPIVSQAAGLRTVFGVFYFRWRITGIQKLFEVARLLCIFHV